MERFRSILLYTELADGKSAAYERAVRICKRSGAKLRMLAVIPEMPVYLRYPQFAYPSLAKTLTEETKDKLTALAAEAREAGVDVSTNVREGKAYLEIVREALAEKADLVVLSAEDESSFGAWTSTSMHLFRLCPCPVWAVRPRHSGSFKRILAAVDAGAQLDEERGLNEEILQLAASVGSLESAQVEALHAWEAAGTNDEMREKVAALAKESLDRLLKPYGLGEGDVHLVEGDPASAIASFVEDNSVDLLVMGTVARTGVAGFLIGNTAEKALGKVECSVLALKPAGFVSPVEDDQETQ